MGLAGLSWRSLAARRLRTFLTVAGIALGVGVLFASLLTSAGIEAASDRTAREILGRANLRISAVREEGLSPATAETVGAVDGVSVAVPTLEQRVYLDREALDPGATASSVTLLGVEPESYSAAHGLRVVRGSGLSGPDATEALITDRLAAADGLDPGEEIMLAAAGPATALRIVGIVAGDGPLPGGDGRVVIAPIGPVSTALDRDGVTRIDLVLDPIAFPAAVEGELEAALTGEPYVLSDAADLGASLRASTADFQATTALIAAVALFGGAFVIFNTLSMTLTERVREIGLLRAAGATRGQVARFVLAGAVVLGLLGSVLGLAIGFALATLVAGSVASIGPVAVEGPVMTPGAIALAFGVGLLVTIAAALEPAWRAGRISPVEALRPQSDVAGTNPARLRWLLVVFAVVAVLGLIAWPRGADPAGLGRAAAVYAVLLAATLLAPLVLVPLGRVAGAPFVPLARLEERLARGALARDPSRTALTVGALMIGLALIVAIGGMAQNARRSASAWLEEVVPGDIIVTSIRPIGADEGVAEELGALPGVARVTPIGTFDVALAGRSVDAAAVVGSDLLDDGRLTFVAGARDVALRGLDEGGSVILPRSVAERLGLVVGDTVEVPAGEGVALRLSVTGIVERSLPGDGGEAVLVGWRDATDSLGILGADSFAVRFVPGRTADAGSAVEAAAREVALEPASLAEVQGAIAGALGRVFGLFDALAVIAVVVAALGVVNTLWMNVIERVREIGVLRATGMTRRQVARMVVVEAGILGIVGSVLGIVVGLAAGVALLAFGGGRVDLTLDPPWTAIVLALVLGVGVSMAAAYYPARLAARLSIVRAVQYE